MGQTAALVMDYKSMQASKAAAASEAQQAYEMGEMAEISTSQDNVDRSRALYNQLASIGTAVSSQGLTGAGASTGNFKRTEKKFASEDIASRKIMGNAIRRKYKLSGFNAKMGGKAAKYDFAARSAGRFGGDGITKEKPFGI